MPNVHAHLERRAHFADFLLQTGIFNDSNLDRQHQGLYNRILENYLARYDELSLLRQLGVDPDKETVHSETDPSDEARTGQGTEVKDAVLMPVVMLDELFSDGSLAQELAEHALICGQVSDCLPWELSQREGSLPTRKEGLHNRRVGIRNSTYRTGAQNHRIAPRRPDNVWKPNKKLFRGAGSSYWHRLPRPLRRRSQSCQEERSALVYCEKD